MNSEYPDEEASQWRFSGPKGLFWAKILKKLKLAKMFDSGRIIHFKTVFFIRTRHFFNDGVPLLV